VYPLAYIDTSRTNFLTWTFNTMLVAVIATGISLLLGSMLAYPLARMRFRGGALLAIAETGSRRLQRRPAAEHGTPRV